MRKKFRPKKKLTDRLARGLDNFIRIFSPRMAYAREAYRFASEHMFSSYSGASSARPNGSWIGTDNSADSDLIPELDTLRERSRDMVRNDPIASAVIEAMTLGDIGTGIRPQSRLNNIMLGISDTQAQTVQREQEHAWEKWVPYADASQISDFYELQTLADRQILENGEAIFLIRRYQDGRGRYKLYLQSIESDRLDTPGDLGRAEGVNIRGGVEYGKRNQPIRYWIRKSHPGSSGKFYSPDSQEYISVEPFDRFGNPNILHLYFVKRPGQSRGVPFLTPILMLLRDYGEYREAEIVAKRVRACFSMLVTTTDPYGASRGAANTTNASGQRIEEMEPGMVKYLGPGEDITTIEPDKQADKSYEFMERLQREAFAALGMPYEVMAKDFSGTTYTSGRMALLEAWRYFQVRQEWLNFKMNRPVWGMVQEQAYLSGDVSINNFYEMREEWTRTVWIPQGRQWVDPLKEVKAHVEAVNNYLGTIDDSTKSQGKNYEDTITQRGREKKLIKSVEQNNSVPITEGNQNEN